MRVAAAEGAAPAERGGDAGAGWLELRGGARGAEPKTAPAPGAGAAGARRGVASSWSGVGGRGGCGERLAGEGAGWRQRTGIGNGGWVRGASEPCVQEAAAAVGPGEEGSRPTGEVKLVCGVQQSNQTTDGQCDKSVRKDWASL